MRRMFVVAALLGLLLCAVPAGAHTIYGHSNCHEHGNIIVDTVQNNGAGYGHAAVYIDSEPNYDRYISNHYYRSYWGAPWVFIHTKWHRCWNA